MLVAPNIRKLLAPNPSPMTGAGTNTYLVGHGEVLVVDPGPDRPAHLAAIEDATRGERIIATLVTHGHADHLPAAVRLREERGVPIIGHPDLAAADRQVANGEEIRVGAVCLTIYHTPGHASDHLCAWNAADRLLFTGDLIAGEGTVVLSDERRALARYLGSLNRMLALRPALLLPGHGPPVPNAESQILAYLVHRAQREDQILAALRPAPASVDALVARLYADTPAALLPMAARNVRAHLENLEERRMVRQVGEEWEIIE